MLTTRKALYYLDKGKTKEAIHLLETFWNQEVTAENKRDIFMATVLLSDVLYQSGERFPEIYQKLMSILEEMQELEAVDFEREKAKQIFAELDDYFSEVGTFFQGNSLTELWLKFDYENDYKDVYPTPQRVAAIEAELGYKLPKSYIYLMRHTQNGGIVSTGFIPTTEPSLWSANCVAITGIMGIGDHGTSTLNGMHNTSFWTEEWGYPDIGLAIADCPSAGHDMIFLDYRNCGKTGEPAVVHIDQEGDYKIIKLADNFEEFILSFYREEY
ncbi:SMI1/KNR4 family protein [Listeria welshimeri]|uniref:SMI1/KNR4 family protein n=1 Tax=Listeria welshimeri TaxID=1643 RepID=UPI0016291C91|nr:SMI1/KNR4 family protein [Listeria welshimeri]MBC1342284.1 SMI1/KNR4 family protein [Listeria welshimeri]MBC1346709.1 SMI1/KNR4 family protein [Listeria welshimeri]MBC1349715.1 SMI1/KNR4 family protein [Listeria welshimeri]MBC1642913.1 SMI1/KNR4 family protein [Listeria welshimeri]MBC1657668.1 SMI1/KNR4 family protein [Listeria welshimeri]